MVAPCSGDDIQERSASRAIRKIALLGNHTPRQCGIATFTTDLTAALAQEDPRLDCLVLAMNDPGRQHVYPARVRFEIGEGDLPAYRRAADFLNVNAVDVLSVQHEYGIFGGAAGAHLLDLLRELRMPIVATLHTILAEPSATQRAVMDELARLATRIVVMTDHGARLLASVHGVPGHKVDVVPHGIADIPFDHGTKDQLGVEGKNVLLTFGLLSPDKGIEHVIDAMPAILARHPETVYIVLGATHPHVKEHHGESYRLMLEARAARLGVDGSMIFHDRFVSARELADFLGAADIYVTPYLKPEQITSGTLAFAVGSGKAVVSTPYSHAKELLADGRGVLVPWRDPASIAAAVVRLLENDGERNAIRARAAAHGRAMLWPAVARRYLDSFERAQGEHAERRRTRFHSKTLARRPIELPEMRLDHLCLMTDDTGILQHATFDVPCYAHGYCLDDNARALLLAAKLEATAIGDVRRVRALGARYLAFVHHAFDGASGRFRNFMTYERRFSEERGSEDSHGRALWALGGVVGTARDPGRQGLAGYLFHAGLAAAHAFTSPRAWAFALLGIDEYLRAFEGDTSVQAMREELAGRLLDVHRRASHEDWPWFEEGLSYCNARLPQALLVTGSRTGDGAMTAVALRALEWLSSIQEGPDDCFAPIGSNGFYRRGGPKAEFDQQPVEAGAMISACLDAARATADGAWTARARRAFGWFLGQNHLQRPVYDAATGGCRDGIHADRLNENEGAESTLSFLLSLAELHAARSTSLAAPPPPRARERAAR